MLLKHQAMNAYREYGDKAAYLLHYGTRWTWRWALCLVPPPPKWKNHAWEAGWPSDLVWAWWWWWWWGRNCCSCQEWNHRHPVILLTAWIIWYLQSLHGSINLSKQTLLWKGRGQTSLAKHIYGLSSAWVSIYCLLCYRHFSANNVIVLKCCTNKKT